MSKSHTDKKNPMGVDNILWKLAQQPFTNWLTGIEDTLSVYIAERDGLWERYLTPEVTTIR